MSDSDRQESGVINVMSVNDELDQVLNGVIGEMLMISEMIVVLILMKMVDLISYWYNVSDNHVIKFTGREVVNLTT